jgi:pimeloyl-ACP methyl ester carboxylesterase
LALVVLSGASGSGKTAIAATIAHRYPSQVDVFHFDSIGVPPLERMIAEHGSGEAWQRAMTFKWMARLAPSIAAGRSVLLEGQMRLSFAIDAASAAGIDEMALILVDCDDETRRLRLTNDRGQPDLANDRMMDWARYLRVEALTGGFDVLDTTDLTVEQSADFVMARLAST